jgi:glycosyltransferase involved in cell wall biosynthesis
MRILILGPYKVIGGVATVVEELALAFVRRGDEVTVVTLEPCLKENDLPSGVNIIAPHFKKADSIQANSILERMISIFDPGYIIQLISVLKNEQYDITISSLYYSAFLAIANAQKKVHILHGFRGFHKSFSRRFRAKLANESNILGAKLADTVIANSYLTAVINSSMFRIDSAVVPLGVSLNKDFIFSSEENRDIDVLYVGRLISAKSIPVILKALAMLSKDKIKLTSFHIIGEGSETDRLKALTEHLGIQNQVTFHGYLPREKISEYYARSRCLVSLNPSEPFGLTYLEALAHGVPIVLCRGSGFSAFCDERFACLVDRQPKSVAEGIDRALTNQWDRNWISQYTLATFSWDRTVELILDTIKQRREKFEHTDC